MRTAELVQATAIDTGLSPTLVTSTVNEFVRQAIARVVAETPVEAEHFGRFDAVTSPMRQGRSPRDGSLLQIPTKRMPSFTTTGNITGSAVEVDSNIVHAVATNCELSPEITTNVLNAVFTAIRTALLQGDRVTIEAFGIFELLTTRPRTLIDPDSGESFTSREKKSIRFSASKDFKVALSTQPPAAASQKQ